MVYNNVLEAVGHTPMVRLQRMNPEGNAQILVKFEGLNVGGSIKTRTALNMIEEAEQKGLIHPDTVIVEPTSGNQGIGLALIGAVRDIVPLSLCRIQLVKREENWSDIMERRLFLSMMPEISETV